MIPNVLSCPEFFNSIYDHIAYNTIEVVGGQFGDEGKGKITQLLALNADVVVRSQGGNNAGHTIVVEGKEYKLHLIPCGVLTKHCQCYIAGGVVVDPQVFLDEIDILNAAGINTKERVWISPNAHVIFPYHIHMDAFAEAAKGDKKIGTTKRGIGPVTADRVNRVGIRVADLLNTEKLKELLKDNIERVNAHYSGNFDVDEMFQASMKLAEKIRPYVKYDLELLLNKAINELKNVLFEGAQGVHLHNIFGTNRGVTSSGTCASDIAAGAGVGPTKIKTVMTIFKAYMTRVGSGPMPTEVDHFLDNHVAREIGVTTLRLRRMGHFDVPLAKTSNLLNGTTLMALTKIDILDTKDKVKLCVAYSLEGKMYDEAPLGRDWENVTPIYEEMDGWKTDTTKVRRYEDLPIQAKAYIERIEALCGLKFGLISVGPDREATFVKN